MKPSRPNTFTAWLCSAMLAIAAAPCTVLAQPSGQFAAVTLPNEKGQWQATESYNKDVVLELSKSMLSDTDINEIGQKFAPNLIQHDSKLLDGRHAMQNWILGLRQQSPALQLSIKHAIADRDQVFIHSHLSSTPDNEFSGQNRYDMYRLDRGLIVEHWAVQAPAPTESESGNSAFNDLYVYAQRQRPGQRI